MQVKVVGFDDSELKPEMVLELPAGTFLDALLRVHISQKSDCTADLQPVGLSSSAETSSSSTGSHINSTITDQAALNFSASDKPIPELLMSDAVDRSSSARAALPTGNQIRIVGLDRARPGILFDFKMFASLEDLLDSARQSFHISKTDFPFVGLIHYTTRKVVQNSTALQAGECYLVTKNNSITVLGFDQRQFQKMFDLSKYHSLTELIECIRESSLLTVKNQKFGLVDERFESWINNFEEIHDGGRYQMKADVDLSKDGIVFTCRQREDYEVQLKSYPGSPSTEFVADLQQQLRAAFSIPPGLAFYITMGDVRVSLFDQLSAGHYSVHFQSSQLHFPVQHHRGLFTTHSVETFVTRMTRTSLSDKADESNEPLLVWRFIVTSSVNGPDIQQNDVLFDILPSDCKLYSASPRSEERTRTYIQEKHSEWNVGGNVGTTGPVPQGGGSFGYTRGSSDSVSDTLDNWRTTLRPSLRPDQALCDEINEHADVWAYLLTLPMEKREDLGLPRVGGPLFQLFMAKEVFSSPKENNTRLNGRQWQMTLRERQRIERAHLIDSSSIGSLTKEFTYEVEIPKGPLSKPVILWVKVSTHARRSRQDVINQLLNKVVDRRICVTDESILFFGVEWKELLGDPDARALSRLPMAYNLYEDMSTLLSRIRSQFEKHNDAHTITVLLRAWFAIRRLTANKSQYSKDNFQIEKTTIEGLAARFPNLSPQIAWLSQDDNTEISDWLKRGFPMQ